MSSTRVQNNFVRSQAVASAVGGGAASSRNGARRTGTGELIVLLVLVCAALGYGWAQRDMGGLTAETGAGYYLGIIGSLAMLLLLVYPLRKRMARLRFLGNVPGWFRLHMILGVVGPALVILHSNFSLGSLNSTVALSSMLIVAGSGLIGRLLYTRIHRGLYGRRAHVREYLGDVETFKAAFAPDLSDGSPLLRMLKDYEARRLSTTAGLLVSLWRALSGPFSRLALKRRAMRQVKQVNLPAADAAKARRQFNGHLDRYLRAIAKTEAFALYERLFALWHLLHLPLFIILVFATLAHVVAVHLY